MDQRERDRERRTGGPVGLWIPLILTVLALVGWQADAAAQLMTMDDLTYAEDVAPIMTVCTQCHQDGGIGPMSLITYDEVRQWAPLIKHRVSRREMPPWGLDHSIGSQNFADDPSLTEREIETIVRWVDSGSPPGDLTKVPDPMAAADWNAWYLEAELGPPDFVLTSQEITIPAEGIDQFPDHSLSWDGLPEDRIFRAAELKNTEVGRGSLHHGHAILEQEGRPAKRFTAMGAGKRYDVFAEDTGVRLPAGPGRIDWFLHYYPIGEEFTDTVQVAVWLYPEDVEPRFTTEGEQRYVVGAPPFSNDILVPPHGSQTLHSEFILDKPMLIHSFRPHMHLHGITASMSVLYPAEEGGEWNLNVSPKKKEVLTRVDNYNHMYQLNYQYEADERPLLPAGSVLLLEAEFDNTDANPLTIDPDQWVTWGQRSVDAMAHIFLYSNYLTEEEYQQLKAEREAGTPLLDEDDQQ